MSDVILYEKQAKQLAKAAAKALDAFANLGKVLATVGIDVTAEPIEDEPKAARAPKKAKAEKAEKKTESKPENKSKSKSNGNGSANAFAEM